MFRPDYTSPVGWLMLAHYVVRSWRRVAKTCPASAEKMRSLKLGLPMRLPTHIAHVVNLMDAYLTREGNRPECRGVPRLLCIEARMALFLNPAARAAACAAVLETLHKGDK